MLSIFQEFNNSPKSNLKREETYVCIELTNEAREVVVLEIGGEQKPSELRRVPNDETFLVRAPRHDLVCR